MSDPGAKPSHIDPHFMTQAEANELMELWARRQREEASRQSLITVHDVAEATQLSEQDVVRLLSEIRTPQPSQVHPPSPEIHVSDVRLLDAIVKVGPLSGCAALLVAWLYTGAGPYRSNEVTTLLMLYAILVFAGYILSYAYRTIVSTQVKRALAEREFRSSKR